eukprot:6186112-Pleurochrysis_carterae.AAC.11
MISASSFAVEFEARSTFFCSSTSCGIECVQEDDQTDVKALRKAAHRTEQAAHVYPKRSHATPASCSSIVPCFDNAIEGSLRDFPLSQAQRNTKARHQ